MLERIGNCRILGEIGSGGMATVFKAVQEPLGRTVAIKALKPSIATDSQFGQRFEREANFMASLQHENIIHVHDFVKNGESMYIIMEYVRGIDLYDMLDRTPRLPPDVASIVALQVTRALDYAHFRGIIHRDIKPANIMISHRGEVKLMDFGIARDEGLSDLTETGTGLGTPSYMSPEQILGDKLDFRSDIFSVGIVLYQMLAGRKPFMEDESRSVMQRIRLDKYPPVRKVNSAVPRVLERVVSRCMQKMPANRYPTTQALIDDLTDYLSSQVRANHSSKLVVYMRDMKFLSQEEADEILSAGGPGQTTKRNAEDRRVVKQVALVQASLMAVALLVGGAIEVAHGDKARRVDPSAGGFGEWIERAGHLRVVVEPWAEVFVDGKRRGTTPMAYPLPLPPGPHYVRLQSPYHKSIEFKVEVPAGKVVTVNRTLKPTDRAP